LAGALGLKVTNSSNFWMDKVIENISEPCTDASQPTVVELVSPWTQTHVTIVGTAHVSKESATQVTEIIARLRPGLVIVELCQARENILKEPENSPDDSIAQLLEKVKTIGVLPVAMGYFYKSVTAKLNVHPGLEFRAANEEVLKIGPPHCKLVLGDRPVQITLKRMWASLSPWEKVKLIFGLIRASFVGITAEEIEAMKNSDMLTAMMKELADEFPGIVGPLVDERDQFLSYIISRARNPEGPPVVVAVVGMAHMEGIKKYWDKEIDVKALCQIPAVSTLTKSDYLLMAVMVFTNLYIIGQIFSHLLF